jgi:acetoin utilization deacetylase AcuC-like enzyme
MAIAYITHSDCLRHDMGHHPERPERLSAINDRLIRPADSQWPGYGAAAVRRTGS